MTRYRDRSADRLERLVAWARRHGQPVDPHYKGSLGKSWRGKGWRLVHHAAQAGHHQTVFVIHTRRDREPTLRHYRSR